MREHTDIGVIGAGRLGGSLASALSASGQRVVAMSVRRPPIDSALLARVPGARGLPAQDVVERADLVFVSVPDAAIERVTAGLTFRPGQRVVHCSGALGLQVLDAASAAGALRGCLHPLQSFAEPLADPARFRGIVVGVEGDGPLAGELQALVGRLGARAVSLSGIDRARYHAAAVFASNYIVAAVEAATATWRSAGLPAELARVALAPLTAGAADNIAHNELAQALTGPIARGDVSTVRHHLAALRSAPELARLYRALGLRLLELPLELPEQARAALQELLAGDDPRTAC